MSLIGEEVGILLLKDDANDVELAMHAFRVVVDHGPSRGAWAEKP